MRQGRFGVAGLPAICLLLALSVLGIAGLGPGPARAQSYGAELGFLSLEELALRHEQLESWSQIVLNGWTSLNTIQNNS